MSFLRGRRGIARGLLIILVAAFVAGIAVMVLLWRPWVNGERPLRFVSTVAGLKGEFGEPFGIAVNAGDIYVSDGQNGKIWKIEGGNVTVFADGLDTPSGIAFDKDGNLVVADSGNHTIKSVDKNGTILTIAGFAHHNHFADGEAVPQVTDDGARFNGPIGIAISGGRIFVADTYNDRIRVIENGKVSTLAGSTFGYADGAGADAKFYTPCGVAVWHDKLVVADTGNRRIRVVEPDGRVWTLAGTGELALKDGLLAAAAFVQPTAIATAADGSLIVADGNAIRRIGGDVIPVVRTISNDVRGTRDGALIASRFNRPSGVAFDGSGNIIVADSDNRLIRRIGTTKAGHEISTPEIETLREKPEEFRTLQPPRWPYDPPDRVREIAGTMGELRGDIPEQKEGARFHNGLDIAGAYGEAARFVRSEKVLLPIAADNFNTLRESLRTPSLGYVHVRIGRDSSSKPFADPRFQFLTDGLGKELAVRVPRGTKFTAGEPVGTLNSMNHVHLIAGRSGFEMNSLDALVLPGISDTKVPVIETVELFPAGSATAIQKDERGRMTLTGKTRIVMRSYDQTDGNAARRRLGIYKAGYQICRADLTPLGDIKWTIKFDRMPRFDAAKLVYGDGSHSGATGETIFNYIVTNRVEGDTATEDYLEPSTLGDGFYIIRVFAADYFGNQSYADIQVEIKEATPQ